jgi:signal transduction histidine kinase/ligand-binding sensor domain-containing protein
VKGPHSSICSMSSPAVIKWSKIRNAIGSMVRVALIGLLTAIACSAASALDSDRTIAQFAHTAWGLKDGAPGPIGALAQSPDGYLWLGTSHGLYRFDGVGFEHYQPQSVGPFPAPAVSSLLALPNGDLWIGHWPRGISLLRNGNITNYTTHDGVPNGAIAGFAEDREGTIWAASGSGLARLEGQHWKEVGGDWNFQWKSANAIFLDRGGTLWIATEDTLVFLPMGARRFQPTGIPVGEVAQIAQAASGKLWMAEVTRSVRPIPLSDNRQPPDETEVRVGSQGILFDNDGALWITSLGDGLRRCPAPELLKGKIKEFSSEVESFTSKDGLSDNLALAILQDREGNIWVGTKNGLDRFRKTNLVPVVLPFKFKLPVSIAGDAGDVWVEDAFTSLAGSEVVTVRLHGGRADRVGNPIQSQVISAYRDPSGAIWWICTRAIYRYEAGRYTEFALPPSFPKPYLGSSTVATEDGSGAFWLSAEADGLLYRKDGVWHRLESTSDFTKLGPMTAFTDWMGRAWFGYEGGTILLTKDGSIQRVFPYDDSPVGGVETISGRGRHIWVGGDRGLAFFDGNRFRRVLPADAETFGWVTGVEETSNGGLWLTLNRGAVIEIPSTEIQKVLADPSWRVKYRTFNSSDGVPGSLKGAIQGTDGKLWFIGLNEFAWVDPANILTNVLPPPVSIRSVTANGSQAASLTNLALPPRTTDLQIGYTALSLAAPEKVRFRYRLEGVDKDWQDAGTRREALYTRLGPGKYHFRVIACNNDGVWNEIGASLNFTIAPVWYQTAWFLTFCALTFLMLLWSLYQLRLRQLKYQFNRTLEARVDERTRIARDLHDTLLQSFNALLLRFQAASNLLPAHPDEAKERVDRAIEQASAAISEGRDAVHELRSGLLTATDLAQGITTFAEELLEQPSVSVRPDLRVQIEGTPVTLNPIVRDESFRIAAEAVRNAIRHASAQHIEVEIRYDEQQLRVRIRDDGKGIDPAVVDLGHAPGHWGLRGMRERAKLVGGNLEVWSEPGSGTELELTIPGGSAYDRSPGSWRSAFKRIG